MSVRYRFSINTETYVCGRCSKKNWEAGTRNDYMLAINGKTGTENSIREVRWLLDLFQGKDWQTEEWSKENPKENFGLSERYVKWLAKKCHNVTCRDRLCGFDRKQRLSGYGWMQGYFDRDEVIQKLIETGSAKIPFSYLYDARQYDKAMNGCYMLIEKVA